MKIVVITYQSGVMIAKFKDDPELVETLVADFDHIQEIFEVDFDGRVATPERAIRELIRMKGKAAARKYFDLALEGGE